ncbi:MULTISPECIES: heavy metal translocating P-type ATPase [Clostridia]|uniref:Cadmium-translocating P-type ATPase n=2 Tax=Clostridia TaxID=186801 RepID=A0A8I0ADF6_9CLOT|nr:MULTISPECIES: heavy metal translocating P-type ATPase [Clostridia]MBC5640008.1 cadmium-translocating P-type ATPase [Clostridium lentum]MBC5654228.1 cadmium-translocating P-type ATPase [Blautia lenta]
MGNKEELQLTLEGLNCANCARKIEEKVGKMEGVKESNLNFTTTTLNVKLERKVKEEHAINEIKKIVEALEPHVKVEKKVSGKTNVQRAKFEVKPTLIIGTILYLIAVIGDFQGTLGLILFGASYLLIGGEVVLTAIKNIAKGQVFDENFLMTVATIGAFTINQYPEAVAVMLFYEIGETIQGYAVNKSRSSISSLMDIRADYANIIINGKEKKVSPETVKVEDVILVKPGEKVPLDGVVIEGESFIDTSALTGESVPRKIVPNDEILSGGINTSGLLKVKVTKKFGESTVSRILEMVENAASKKADTEKFITKFAKVYTPIVVVLAILIAVIPSIFIKDALFSTWLYRSLVFLVVSCPCALVVSVPLGFFAGIGGASKKGVLVKGSNYLELLKDLETVVFDKTGTLTEGVFSVTEINTNGIDKEKLIEVAAMAESFSNHPIAISIIKEYGKEIDKEVIKEYKEISGRGIKAVINNEEVLVGNSKLMNEFNILYNEVDSIGTVVYCAINGEFKGSIVISDKIKENAVEALINLKKAGVKKTVMLTGDNKKTAYKVGEKINIDEVHSELLPLDKVKEVEEIMKRSNKNGKLAFVGDGVNDAPVLARADIGIAMGGIGSDAAIEAADIVLMKDDINALVDAINVSKKTNKILWQNIVFALGIKILVMVLGTFGIANMWTAVFADVGVTIIAIINSTRCFR